MEAFEAGVMHRDVSEGNIMMSKDPNAPYKGFVQDFDYALNWRKFLAQLGLGDKREDWDKFMEEECAKLIQKKNALVRERLLKKLKANQDAKKGDVHEGQDAAATGLNERQAGYGSQGQGAEPSQSALGSLDTEGDPRDTERISEDEAVQGVEIPVATPALSSDPPSEEEVKRQCKLRTVCRFSAW